jgi:hypothetical protein
MLDHPLRLNCAARRRVRLGDRGAGRRVELARTAATCQGQGQPTKEYFHIAICARYFRISACSFPSGSADVIFGGRVRGLATEEIRTFTTLMFSDCFFRAFGLTCLLAGDWIGFNQYLLASRAIVRTNWSCRRGCFGTSSTNEARADLACLYIASHPCLSRPTLRDLHRLEKHLTRT